MPVHRQPSPPRPAACAAAASDAAERAPESGSADEQRLIRRAQDGCERAFESLYRSHVRRVFAAVWRIAGGVEARAEELTQESFIRAWKKLPQFRGDSAFSTWLHRLAVNVALMDLRSRATGAGLDSNASSSISLAAPCAPVGLQLDLESAISTLPPRARAVLILFDIEGWTHAEIATELGMAVGSSKAQLHRARGLLRERLEA